MQLVLSSITTHNEGFMKKTFIVALVALFMLSIAVAQDKPAAKDKQTKSMHHETKKDKKDGCSTEKSCCEGMKGSKQKSSDDATDKKADAESPEKK
jgi:hypothetical protein